MKGQGTIVPDPFGFDKPKVPDAGGGGGSSFDPAPYSEGAGGVGGASGVDAVRCAW